MRVAFGPPVSERGACCLLVFVFVFRFVVGFGFGASGDGDGCSLVDGGSVLGGEGCGHR